MKRGINFYEAALLLFIFYKLNQEHYHAKWTDILFIIGCQVIFILIILGWEAFGLTDKLSFFLWKKVIWYKTRKLGKVLRQQMMQDIKKTKGNPGQFHDPQNTGK